MLETTTSVHSPINFGRGERGRPFCKSRHGLRKGTSESKKSAAHSPDTRCARCLRADARCLDAYSSTTVFLPLLHVLAIFFSPIKLLQDSVDCLILLRALNLALRSIKSICREVLAFHLHGHLSLSLSFLKETFEFHLATVFPA